MSSKGELNLPDDSFVEWRFIDCIANISRMKVRNIPFADVAHEPAGSPTRMLPHNAGACLDEFVFEFETRERPHHLAHVCFFDHRKIGTYDICPGSGAHQRDFRLPKLSNCR